MKNIFETVVALLIVKVVTYMVSKFTGKTISGLSANLPSGKKSNDVENLDVRETIRNVEQKIMSLLLKKKLSQTV